MKTSAANEEVLYHLTLLRHGESTGNVQRLLQGQADYELSPLGRQQSQRLAARWLAEAARFEHIISSPLARALQTAEIISATLDVPLEKDLDWMERDFGNLSGRVLSEQDLNILRSNFKNPFEPLGETGESQWDAYHRAQRAITHLLQRPPGRYLVVAHGGIINQALRVIVGLPPRPGSDGPRFILSNAAFASLSYAPAEQVWRLFRLNDKQHLEGLSADLLATPEVEQANPVHETEGDPPAGPVLPLPMQIRPALSADLEGVIDVFAETDLLHAAAQPDIFRQPQDSSSIRSFYQGQFLLPDAYLLVADLQGEIVGGLLAVVKEAPLAAILKPRRWLSISNIAVKPAYRGLGIGQALMEQAQTLARQLNLHAVELTVWEFNSDARRFYERLGYQTNRRVMWVEVK